MKDFFGLLGCHLKRSVFSLIFLTCTALCTLLMFFFAVEYLNPEQYHTLPGLHYFLSKIDQKGARYFVMMITSFPAAALFYDDWKSGYFKFAIQRSGRAKYAFSVTFSAGISAAAVMILSYIFFSTIVLASFPAVTDLDAETLRERTLGFLNSGLLYTGKSALCYLLYFLTKGAMAAFFAAFAVFQSMIINDKNLTIISPVLIYILYFSFNFFYILPALANPFVLFWNGFKLYLEFGGTQDGSLFSPIAAVYPMIFSLVFLIILPLVEAKILRVKMNNSL